MAKIQIQHPTHEKICEFTCPDLLLCASDAGLTAIAEKEYTTVRITLDWAEVETALTKAMAHLRHRTTTPVPWPPR
jgi:hypothetical protein